MIDVRGVDGAGLVELGACFGQARRSLDLVEHRVARAVETVGIVQLAAVDTQADEDVVLGEEGGPLVVE